MEINWPLLLPAVVLLFYPLDRLLPAYMKCRTIDALLDPAAKHRRKWWRWQPELWADVVRVAAATWFIDFALEPESGKMGWVVTLVIGFILAVGVCCQMRTRREEESVFAPLSYLLGVMLVLLPPTATAAIFVLEVAALAAFRSYVAFLLAGVVLTTGLTFLLGGDILTGVMLAGVHAVALMASFLMEGELVLPVRNRVRATVTPVTVR